MEPTRDNNPFAFPPALMTELEAAADKQHRPIADVVRELVEQGLGERRSREEDARLEKLLLDGLDSELIPVNDAFWADLNAETDQLLEAHRSGKTPV